MNKDLIKVLLYSFSISYAVLAFFLFIVIQCNPGIKFDTFYLVSIAAGSLVVSAISSVLFLIKFNREK